MPEAANPDRRTSSTASIGVWIAVVAVLLLFAGWLAYRIALSKRVWAAFTTQAPTLGKGWIEDLRAGRLDAAYGSTTPSFRARLDRAAFERWVADHPELQAEAEIRGYTMSSTTSAITIGLNGIRLLDARPRLRFQAGFHPAGKGPSLLTLVIVSDGTGNPVVDQAEIEPESPSNP